MLISSSPLPIWNPAITVRQTDVWKDVIKFVLFSKKFNCHTVFFFLEPTNTMNDDTGLISGDLEHRPSGAADGFTAGLDEKNEGKSLFN